ncbi:hypothetical protein RRG08_009721 [Elysia crispata]|uniref:Uncharacterized protein n=1 Tax=Elysia crispata TaxID=231223 RepID=A0AAE0Y7Y1_9GAST|nr:hypothetical protein RRG08_009721 [Elysia crispata]
MHEEESENEIAFSRYKEDGNVMNLDLTDTKRKWISRPLLSMVSRPNASNRASARLIKQPVRRRGCSQPRPPRRFSTPVRKS